ncbi:hypothetical protein A2U01_0098137, partial [Trifolium medium]|nr:hypothetical protein [Trifolium medium]
MLTGSLTVLAILLLVVLSPVDWSSLDLAFIWFWVAQQDLFCQSLIE